jgi:hypothetical protein
MPFSNRSFRADSTLFCRLLESTRTSFSRSRVSLFEPNLGIFDLTIKHRGHGHVERYLRHVISILRHNVSTRTFTSENSLTFLDSLRSKSENEENLVAQPHQLVLQESRAHRRA